MAYIHFEHSIIIVLYVKCDSPKFTLVGRWSRDHKTEA
ncbi:hypothetical protein F383_25301 [Gossypium arboreum]|uniref:Uncharacterized protein n=1 Tax=Gossypium arboreum TaxID=29729 RepID=A0A0B0P2D8_GOSAR|nr:hypothetical protein F383_25301 [Gossypium arboreum]